MLEYTKNHQDRGERRPRKWAGKAPPPEPILHSHDVVHEPKEEKTPKERKNKNSLKKR
jgi:hypothetical protein